MDTANMAVKGWRPAQRGHTKDDDGKDPNVHFAINIHAEIFGLRGEPRFSRCRPECVSATGVALTYPLTDTTKHSIEVLAMINCPNCPNIDPLTRVSLPKFGGDHPR